MKPKTIKIKLGKNCFFTISKNWGKAEEKKYLVVILNLLFLSFKK